MSVTSGQLPSNDTSPPLEPWTFTIEDAALLLGISTSAAYKAAHDGIIPSIRIGRRILVPRLGLQHLCNGGNRADTDAPQL